MQVSSAYVCVRAPSAAAAAAAAALVSASSCWMCGRQKLSVRLCVWEAEETEQEAAKGEEVESQTRRAGEKNSD